jgi:hypothetical protein
VSYNVIISPASKFEIILFLHPKNTSATVYGVKCNEWRNCKSVEWLKMGRRANICDADRNCRPAFCSLLWKTTFTISELSGELPQISRTLLYEIIIIGLCYHKFCVRCFGLNIQHKRVECWHPVQSSSMTIHVCIELLEHSVSEFLELFTALISLQGTTTCLSVWRTGCDHSASIIMTSCWKVTSGWAHRRKTSLTRV